MPDDFCLASLTEKNRKYVWINTAGKGLCRLHLPSLQGVSFLQDDGLEISNGDIAATTLPGGMFLFGNSNGFSVFNPEALQARLSNQKPVITGFLINGKSLNAGNLNNSGSAIRLTHHENNISISFSTLDYFNAVNQTYSVKLSDVEKNWTNIGLRSQVDYRNLAPGHYTLMIKTNSGDLENEANYAIISFIISPPFWKQAWFYTLLGAIIITVVYLLYRYRVNTIKKQEALKSEYNRLVNETEIKALRSQMNPHFIFNSLNAINRYILKNEKKEASEYLSKFSKLIRLILDNSRQTKIPLSQDLNALCLYLELEKLRFQDNFSYSIHIDDAISTESVFIPPLLIQPIVENAIWHGLLPKVAASHIQITMKLNGIFLDCTVEDNGIGRKKSAEMKTGQVLEKSSVGIHATEQRLRLLFNNDKAKKLLEITDLFDITGNPAGTRVTLHIPYYNKP
jgi:hypothetical protein